MAELNQTMNAEQLCSLLVNVVDEMFEGFQVIGEDGRYLYLNKAAANQGKRTPQELVGKRMVDEYPGTENTDMYRRLMQCFKTGQPDNMLNKFEFPDGSTGWFQLVMEPIRGGVLILSIDVSETKQREFELIEKNKELEKTLRLLVGRETKMVELKAQMKKLSESDKSIA